MWKEATKSVESLSSLKEIWEKKRKHLTLQVATGQILKLKSLGKAGAEGKLYLVEGLGNIVAKVFNSPDIARKKEYKIESMIRLFQVVKDTNPSLFNYFLKNITFPRAKLYTKEREFCGFIMNKVETKDCLSLGQFLEKYRDYSRPTDYSLKIVVVERLVEIVEKLNREGIVVGDMNYDNVFICKCPERTIRVKLVDVDSFQFQWGGEFFRLDGIHPDLVAPEILRGELPSVRTDSFVIAILMFKILMNGFSPFQYVPDEENDEMVEERILKGRNVFNSGKPPKGLPSFEFLGNLKDIIEKALNPEPFKRPSTTEILTVIQETKKNIRVCPSGHHTIPSSEGKCLFCYSIVS